MLKIVARRPGAPERLRPVTVDPPACGADDILVAVEAAGVNYADCVARMGLYRSSWELIGWPLTPGFEIAGRITACGPRVTGFAVGDRVMAVTMFGGYAEQVAVPSAQVFAIPDMLDTTEAAAVLVSFLTALHAMALAAPRAGAPVLVHSAAGAAGSALAQVATARGNRVIGIVGAGAKCDAARTAGAAEVIVRERDWPARARALAPDGYVAVFDAGGDTLRESARLVAPMGRLVAYGSHGILSRRGGLLGLPLAMLRYWRMPRFGALELANANRSVMAFNLSYLFDERAVFGAMVTELLDGLAQGLFRLPPIMRLPLAEAAEAHRRLQSGRTVGKLVLTMRGEESNSPISP